MYSIHYKIEGKKTTNLLQYTITSVLEPIYIPQAFNTGIYINHLWWWPRWPILFCRLTQQPVITALPTGKTWERFWKKMKVTGLGRKKLVSEVCRLYSDLLHNIKGKPLSSGFSTDGSLISASTVPYCRVNLVTWCFYSLSQVNHKGLCQGWRRLSKREI